MFFDIRYALRALSRSPGFTLITVLSLALGIGANTAIFSLLNAVVLRMLPVPEPEQLVVATLKRLDGFGNGAMSHWHYQLLRDRNSVLAGFAARTAPPPMAFGNGDSVEQVQGELVTGNYFETLRVHAVIGRLLTQDDDRIPDGHPVCVISYGLWQRSFGGGADAIGRKVQLNRVAFTVIGVTPRDFVGINPESPVEVRVPLMMVSAFGPARPLNKPNFTLLQTVGRLKPGVNLASAQAALAALYRQIDGERPKTRLDKSVKLVLEPGESGISGVREIYRKPLLLLMSVVGLVLLIASANVASLLMTRASGRRREIAIRLALGAGRARLIRQLLAESILLSMTGAAVGLVMAWWVDRTLIAIAPRLRWGVPLAFHVSPDWRVLAFTAGASILVGILFGLVPALQATRPELGPALKGEPARVGFAFPKVMVVAQVGLSMILLIGAGLFLRSLRNLKSIAPGFDPEHLVMLTINPPVAGYKAAETWNLIDTILDRAKATRGVILASWARASPLEGSSALMRFDVPGYLAAPGEDPVVWTNGVGPDFFRTLDTPLVAGRAFTGQDGRDGRMTMIINEKTAKKYWPHENPLGKHVNAGTDCEIVGIVRDAKFQSLRQDIPMTAYTPLRMHEPLNFTLHVRVAGASAPVTAALLREVRNLDRGLPIYHVTTMEAQIDDSLALDRLMAILTTLFGVLAIVLAMVGLYGVMAYVVAARTREIGIRMALGADGARVLRRVIGESAILTAIGIAIGVPLAWWASLSVASFLYGFSPTDPWLYAALAVLLAVIALTAAWIPARRAARVDPMVALRAE